LFRAPKIQPWHLDRLAIVYVRQSTAQQVAENKESADRQYALSNGVSLSSEQKRTLRLKALLD
jgi:hypothetical protein